MATCAALSVADEALHATIGNANFQRLCRLLMCGGITLFMEVFDLIHPPANLPLALSNPTIKSQLQRLRKNRVLSQTEWDCLFLPTGMHGKSADFDISLLFKLLRNICSLTPPATGWDNLPNNTDHSLEADLARIKYYRNSIYGHNQSMEINDADFVNLWTEISEALLRIASHLSSAKKDEWKESIDKFRHHPLTPDAQQYVAELRTWCKKDMDSKDEVEKLRFEVQQMHLNQQEHLNTMQQEQSQQREMINMVLQLVSAKQDQTNAESFDAAIGALTNGVATACNHPHVIKHQVIDRLPKRCVRDLKRMARDRDVKLDQPEWDTIRLEGLPKDVMDMNTEVSNAIQEQREREHREEQADQMSKTVQWYMVNASGKLEPFDKIANNKIESAYKAKRPSLLFAHDNLKAEINFGNREVTFLRNGKIKRVLRKDVLPLPVEWDPQPRDECGKEEILHLVSLAQDSQEFKKVQEQFIHSLRGNKIISITNIERIQNPSMFNSYMLRKQTMDEQNGTLENELCLFHGTKYDSVKSINVQGFNRSLCGENGVAYGDGVYFAKEAQYSLTFSQASRHHGARCMYLARVLVGKYTAGERGMKTPPAIDPNKPEILYDSVVNMVDDPTIFVVFNDYHVYPEYLITFKELSR